MIVAYDSAPEGRGAPAPAPEAATPQEVTLGWEMTLDEWEQLAGVLRQHPGVPYIAALIAAGKVPAPEAPPQAGTPPMALIGELDEARVEFKRRADIPSATHSAQVYARGRADGLWQAIAAIGGEAGLPGKWDALAARLAQAEADRDRIREQGRDDIRLIAALTAEKSHLEARVTALTQALEREAKRDAG